MLSFTDEPSPLNSCPQLFINDGILSVLLPAISIVSNETLSIKGIFNPADPVQL